MASFTLSKYERLLNRKDFVNLNRLGKRYHTAHFTVISKGNRSGIRRVGITVGKKTGNSVKRNKTKRLIREFFRLHKACFPQGHDIVIAAKRGAYDLSFRKVKEELSEIILDKEFRA